MVFQFPSAHVFLVPSPSLDSCYFAVWWKRSLSGVVWLRVGCGISDLLMCPLEEKNSRLCWRSGRRCGRLLCTGGRNRFSLWPHAPPASVPPVNKHWACCSHIPSPAVRRELRGHRGYWSRGSFSKHVTSRKEFNLG